MKRIVIKKFRSYSLIETLVAITMLVAIVLGVTVLNRASSRNVSGAKHRLQIALFAQQQMEILRNMRDSSINIPGSDWNSVFQIPGSNYCNNHSKFRLIYNHNDNRYQLSAALSESREVNYGNPPFIFNYYLECGEVGNITIPGAGSIDFNDSTRPRPIRFRFVARWNEYGQEHMFWLNNYLTSLGTIASNNPGPTIPGPGPTSVRLVMSIDDPSVYNANDIVNLAKQGIDIQNWTYINNDGRMTPVRDLNGNYSLGPNTQNVITRLHNETSQRIYWIGISLYNHIIHFGYPQITTELANATKSFIDELDSLGFTDTYVGVYAGSKGKNQIDNLIDFGFGTDEIITYQKDLDFTIQQQGDYSQLVRSTTKQILDNLGLDTKGDSYWNRVRWLVTGDNENSYYSLTDDDQSLWAHHTNLLIPSGPNDSTIQDLIYNDRMAQKEYYNIDQQEFNDWTTLWKDNKKYANSDRDLVGGLINERKLTSTGLAYFNI